jgi:excisionase family DNA binding protein
VSVKTVDLPTLLTPAEVAKRLRVTVGTLNVWRCVKRTNLKYIKVGRAVRYRPEDVEEFLRQNLVSR